MPICMYADLILTHFLHPSIFFFYIISESVGFILCSVESEIT